MTSLLPVLRTAIRVGAPLVVLASTGCGALHLYASRNDQSPPGTPPGPALNLTFLARDAVCATLLPTPPEAHPAPTLVRPTRARRLTPRDLHDNLFVGIALAGGGSRAANFSAAVLYELGALGVLPQHVTALSSVSGSSITAAYYGLYASDPTWWNKEAFQQR